MGDEEILHQYGVEIGTPIDLESLIESHRRQRHMISGRISVELAMNWWERRIYRHIERRAAIRAKRLEETGL